VNLVCQSLNLNLSRGYLVIRLRFFFGILSGYMLSAYLYIVAIRTRLLHAALVQHMVMDDD
jgi:hypothetical protein